MNRNTDRAGLLCNGTIDGLANPPGCVGAEFKPAPRIKFSYGPQETHIPLLNQIKKGNAPSKITLGNAHHQSQICADERLVCIRCTGMNCFHFAKHYFIRRQVAIERALGGKRSMLADMCQQPLRIFKRQQVHAEKDAVRMSGKVIPKMVDTPLAVIQICT